MTSTSSRSFKKLFFARINLPGWTKTAWKLADPSWARQTVNATKLGAEPACVGKVKIGERVVATNASTKMTSQIFKKTSTACVFHVCWLKFLLYPEKRICPGKVGYEFRWITALSLYDCLKRLNCERSFKTLCILRFCGEAHVPSTIPRKHQTCHWFLVGSAYINKTW